MDINPRQNGTLDPVFNGPVGPYPQRIPDTLRVLNLFFLGGAGVDNFQNEIIWGYTSGGVSKQWFGRKHDTILVYCKQLGSHYIHLPQEKSYTATLPEPHTPSGQRLGVQRDHVCELCGRGSPGQKYRMVTMRDVWSDLRGLFRNDKEMIGYPTQKPERLLDRIISSSCPECGVVADFFCGGGTTPAVAQRLNRRWVACDNNKQAIDITVTRLRKDMFCPRFGVFQVEKDKTFCIGGDHE